MLLYGEGPDDPDHPQHPLTSGEWEIAVLVADDLTNKQIAGKLYISVKTVEYHITRIFAKLATNSRAGIARWIDDRRVRGVGHARRLGEVGHARKDYPSEDLKPDPLKAETEAQLEDFLRRFWVWSGRPSSRKIAVRAGGAFSHTTISKLINNRAGKPPLRLHYVQGLIRGCGGDTMEEERWVAAWRRIHLGKSP